ncbi:thioredoxin-disulfide reductase [Lyticum sinuosum]|uniref:Thioredoxin reductase n=1 Tax=Lyticum sinuosum TaxID=1332059 RepID=A0AAE5AGW3_9RICK|nr:thioredoxin-disulfide reductase [Lyticum sinuosum]MDZ5760875.1 Thioredoxin reductase [Lyticum sinuosum]
MPQIYKTKMLIIGSGPAGCTAAIYGARACLNPIMLCGSTKGGQLTITTDVENYPGFAKIIQGPWLMEQMLEQSRSCGAVIIDESADKINFHKDENDNFHVFDGSDNIYLAKTIILSTGATAKWLGLENEKKFLGRGVSGCATCDGFFFRGKNVLVVGGGNTAVEEALYLTNHATKVILIHRKDSLKAEKTLQKRLMSHNKIEILWNKEIEDILGNEDIGVNKVILKDTINHNKISIDIDGIFIAIGHRPNTDMFRGFINMDSDGYIIVNNDMSTNINGIYACGDVCDKKYRQAVVAAGNGCIAALEAENYINSYQQ